MDRIEIKCVNDGSRFLFFDRNKDGWTTEINGNGITAKLKVSDYIANPSEFFSEIAGQWRGWEGIKSYQSLEGELMIQATHDKKGAVLLTVILSPNDGTDDWKLQHCFNLELGQLERISQEMKAFFK
ncbi:MAG: DUF6228 family protein [Candidatus Omnitrophota bacterium]